jgi:4-diphosphocytidyl-2-C-methyl-D-erythritol kinase
MKTLLNLPAPAKINLFLHMVGRRPDGYHLLQSVFALIDWQDTLHLTWRPNGQISREDLSTPLPADDLCLRAARALQQATGCVHGAHIQIEKSIPAEAGMGGGSSDAATCLLGLNRLWGLDLGMPALCTLGLQLGADVPFFLQGRNAWVEGIGEKISPIQLPKAKFLIIKPLQGLSTKAIFSAPDLKRDTKPVTISGFAANAMAPFELYGLDQKPYGFGQNDLQTVAIRLCPEIGEVLQFLDSVGLCGRMTGSGSAVFALLPDELDDTKPNASREAALVRQQMLADQVAQHKWQFRFCEVLDQHPIAEKLSQAEV